MKRRYHLIEIHEQECCPKFIRDSVTDYLQYAITFGDAYRPIFDKLNEALELTKTKKIIDLCSGGGGAWKGFKEKLGQTEIVLTDLYPNQEAFQQMKSEYRLEYSAKPVSAIDVPEDLDGFRTMFSAFHHFKPNEARAILQDAVNKGCGIGIFEATPRMPKALILMLLTPILALFLTPMIRPFRWSRIIFTYLLPVIPFIIGFDGIVSVLRTYTPEELLAMTPADDGKYKWKAGAQQDEKSPIPVVYLIGYPKNNETQIKMVK